MEAVPVLINGRRGHRVDVFDRGFQYGDGLFETLLIDDQQPLFWNEHIERLEEGCRRLDIPPPDRSILQQEALELSRGAEQGVLKMMLTRGRGDRGYLPPFPVHPTRVLSLHPLPPQLEQRRQEGVKVRLCHTPLGINPALAGVKHCNRLEQIMARREWSDADVYEGLMCDIEGWLVEGTATNLFWRRSERVFTPRLDRCGVAGVIRGWVMKQLREWKMNVNEVRESPEGLLETDEVFLTNSVIGIVPVVAWVCREHDWPVGEMTRRLQAVWP